MRLIRKYKQKINLLRLNRKKNAAITFTVLFTIALYLVNYNYSVASLKFEPMEEILAIQNQDGAEDRKFPVSTDPTKDFGGGDDKMEYMKSNVQLNSMKDKTLGGCAIPQLDPFDPKAMKFMRPPDEYNCTKDYPLLFYTDFDSNLIINGTIDNYGLTECCYKRLFRSLEDEEDSTSPSHDTLIDNKYTLGEKCFSIEENVTKIPESIEFIAVFCRTDSSELKMMDLFSFFHLKPKVEERIKKLKNKNSEDDSFVNIVIFGIDTVSHMSFLRGMPKTSDYITKNLSAVSMNGQNVVGVDTFPNLAAALAGESNIECSPPNSGLYFDNCPWIWKYLSSLGYRTSYGEDAARYVTFNDIKGGFRNIPTDYYLRPMMIAASSLPPNSKDFRFCNGPRLAVEILLDSMKKAAHAFRNDKKYFQLIWTSTLTHETFYNHQVADLPLLETLVWLHNGNYLKKTVLILMSDHGYFRDPISTATFGRIEHNMPFLYFIFPDWFYQKYPAAIKNLKMNSRRLTTPFDLHETLLDLGQLENIENSRIIQRNEKLYSSHFPRGSSLFLEIPLSRNCRQAGIPNQWCICYKNREVVAEITEELKSAGRAVIDAINKKVSPYPQCASWTFDKINQVEKFDTNEDNPTDNVTAYIINVDTMIPGEASFEAMVSHGEEENWIVVDDDITRTSTFGDQSYCVDIDSARPFCYCS